MYQYVGNGRFIPGIPTRDLTDKEAEHYPEVRTSDLYKHVKTPKKGTGGE